MKNPVYMLITRKMEEACFVNAGWIVEQILFIPGIFCHLLDQE